MIVTTIDSITTTRGEPIVVKIGTPATRTIINTKANTQQVSLSDSYQVVPYAKRVTADFNIPASVQADLTRIDQEILNEVNGREIAIIDATVASKSYADGVGTQLMTNIAAAYISNDSGANYILKTEATQLALEYDTATGTTLASLQDLYNTGVTVGNAQATYTQDITALADGISAEATRTTALEAEVDGVSASVTQISVASVDTQYLNVLWVNDGLQTDPDINGQPRYLYEARAKHSLTVDTGGKISGFIAEAGTTSKFTILADKFEIANGLNPGLVPFSVDTLNSRVQFNGVVSFTNVTDVPALGSTPQEVVDAVNAGSTTSINGGRLDTSTIGTGVIYNTNATELNYTMKIDLNNGYIHIK